MRKRILFLDFDGTLAPIVKDPDAARLPDDVKEWLERVAGTGGVKVAIVTGRSLADVRRRVGLRNIIYAANHGLEVFYRGRLLLTKGARLRRAFRLIEKELAEALAAIPRIHIENKGLSVAVHFRRVNKKQHAAVKRIFHRRVKPWLEHLPLRATGGKMLWEIRPSQWDKGKAALWIWKKLAPRHLPVYVGDDVTDEDAFRALKPHGVTIRIGKKKRTAAEYRSPTFHALIKSKLLPP